MGQPVQAIFTLGAGFLSATKTGWQIASEGDSGFGLQVGENSVALLARPDCLQ
jgi:hypothetical protein